jgi:gamma-glutamylcyclotransferase (GGCT)/AIG2-like uncharacterized protein YtfP
MNPFSRYAFYGSLRRGMSNFREFQHGLVFHSEETLPGFQLFAMEEFPYAVRTGNPSDRITVEIFKVTDPRVERAFHDLEMNVGYYYDEVLVNNMITGIYLYKTAGPETLVKGGDWVKFFGS